MEINIYIENENDLSDLENRWYITNVFVKKNNKYYIMNVFYIERLLQEFNDSNQQGEPFAIEPNLVIIDKPTKESLIQTLLEQDNYYFYERLKECEIMDNKIKYQLSEANIQSALINNLPTSIDIEKLHRVY